MRGLVHRVEDLKCLGCIGFRVRRFVIEAWGFSVQGLGFRIKVQDLGLGFRV